MKYLYFAPLDKRTLYLTGLSTILILIAGLIPIQPLFALTISPVKMEIAGDPGQTLNGEIELMNEQNEDKVFYSSTANFEARGESGAPYFLPDINKGLSSWIEVQENVALKAGEKKFIPFSIQIPQGTEAGGYFAAIFWGTAPPQKEGGGQVTIGGRLGMLILLSVSGEVKQGGGLLDFKIVENRKVINFLPIIFNYRFSNDGNERIKPSGELKIRNLFGLTAVELDANRRDGNILPGSIRKFEVIWFEKGQDKLAVFAPPTEELKETKVGFFAAAKRQWQDFALGPYRAELNLLYGKDSKVAKADLWFFVIPWQLLSIVILILAVVGFLGTVGLKKYNRWIIAKASGQKK